MSRSTGPHSNQAANHFSLLMVGYYATGKTALLHRFSRHSFEEDYHMTLNSTHATRIFNLDQNFSVKLTLIDSLGSSLGRQRVNVKLPACDAILLVYDITNQESFYRLDKWMVEMKNIISPSTLLILVGTRLDQPYRRRISEEEAEKWMFNNKVGLRFEISSKTNENIFDMFDAIGGKLVLGSKQKQINSSANPEESTMFEDNLSSHARKSRIAVLQKKLKFKEQECDQLWIDYEDALRRISQLEEGGGEKMGKNDLLSSIMETDADEMEGKVKALEDNVKVLEQFYSRKLQTLEQSTCKKVQQYKKSIQIYEGELQNMIRQNKEKGKRIKQLESQRDELTLKLQSTQVFLLQKIQQFDLFQRELSKLSQDMDLNSELEGKQLPNKFSSEFKCDTIGLISQKYQFLCGQLEKRQNMISQREQELIRLSQKHEEQKSDFIKLTNRLLNENIYQNFQLESQYQELTYYRDVVKIKNEGKIETLLKLIEEKEQQFDQKEHELILRIQQRQKSIKLLKETIDCQKQQILFIQEKYDRLYEEYEVKSEMLEKKEELVSRVMEQKVNQIQYLQSFIGKIDNKQKINSAMKTTKIPSSTFTEEREEMKKTKQQFLCFLQHFLDQTKERSIFMFSKLSELSNNMSNIYAVWIEIRMKLECEKGQANAMIKNMTSEFESEFVENKMCFDQYLSEIEENIAKIEGMTQVGIESYIMEYFN